MTTTTPSDALPDREALERDAATSAELRELFSMEPDEELADEISVCSGKWVREAPDVWRIIDESGDEDE